MKLSFVKLRLKFVISPVVKQVPGVGRMTAHLRRQLKFHFTSNHTQSLSLVRTSLSHHESYPAVFAEKQEVSDQLP